MAMNTMALYADLENNSFIYLYTLPNNEMSACILYEDHYYYAPRLEHYMKCPACVSD